MGGRALTKTYKNTNWNLSVRQLTPTNNKYIITLRRGNNEFKLIYELLYE